jgi:hypothetical protein
MIRSLIGALIFFAVLLTVRGEAAALDSGALALDDDQRAWQSIYPEEEEVIASFAYLLIQLKVTFDHHLSSGNSPALVASTRLVEALALMLGEIRYERIVERINFLLIQTNTRTNSNSIVDLARNIGHIPLARIDELIRRSNLDPPYGDHLAGALQRVSSELKKCSLSQTELK